MKISKLDVRSSDCLKKTRIYFFVRNESVMENLMKRHSRPHTEYRKLLPKVYKKARIDEKIPVKWSQKAGCSCGCSPGFIVNSHFGKEVFVTVS